MPLSFWPHASNLNWFSTEALRWAEFLDLPVRDAIGPDLASELRETLAGRDSRSG